MDGDAYKKQAKKNRFEKPVVTLAGTTGHRVLNISFCGSYFMMF